MLPSDVKRLVYAHLPRQDQAALGQTSTRMRQFNQMLVREAQGLAVQVGTLLQVPHSQRTLEDLIKIGLLPRSARTYAFSERKLAVLLSDDVIKSLHLNKDIGVQVDLQAFNHVPSARMPDVRNGLAMLRSTPQAIFSHENFE